MTMHADQPVRIDDVLEHREWLRGVACALLGGDHDADDIVQEALLTALMKPPRSRGRVRAWLRRVARNLVYQRWRREKTFQRISEALAVEAVGGDHAEAVARSELAARVERSIDELPEIYRRVIRMRFYEGLDCAAIAERDGDVPATVRSRLRRALAALRERLRDETGLSDAELSHALVWFAFPSGVATPTQPRAGGRSRRGGAIAAAAVALLVVGWGVVASTGAISLGGTQSAASEAGEATASVDPRARRRVDVRPDPEPRAVRSVTPNSSSASEPSEGAPGRTMVVSGEMPEVAFEGADSSVPWTLSIRALDASEDPQEATVTALEVSPGEFSERIVLAHAVQDVSELWIEASHPDVLPLICNEPVPHGASGLVTLSAIPRVVAASIVVGQIVDPAGEPVEGAHIAIVPASENVTDPQPPESGLSDAEGRFRLRAHPGDDQVVLAWRDDSLVAARRIRPRAAGPSEEPPLRLVLESRLFVAGHIRAPAGFPVDALSIAWYAQPHGETVRADGAGFWIVGETATRSVARLRPDRDGTFRLPLFGTPGGRLAVEGALTAPDVIPERVFEARPTSMGLEIEVAAVPLDVRVTDGSSAVAGASCGIHPATGSCFFETDERGAARVWVRAGATYRVSAEGDRKARGETAVVVPGDGRLDTAVLTLSDPEPTRSWRVEVVGGLRGQPQSLGVALFDPDSTLPFPRRTLEAVWQEGRYVVEGIPPGHWRASLRLGSRWRDGRSAYCDALCDIDAGEADPASSSVVFEPGGRLLVAARDEQGEFVRTACDVFGPTGERVTVRFVGGHRELGRGARSRLGDCGLSQIDRALPPGTYTLRIDHPGYERATESVDVVAGEVRTVILDLRSR